MRPIPNSENPLVLRADFSNQAVWDKICKTIKKSVFGFSANVEFLDDPEYDGVTKEDLHRIIPRNYNHTFIMIVDQITMTRDDSPLLIVDLWEGSYATFRAIPSTVQSIENNLSIANMDFEEFANAVDESGVFRGFSRPHHWLSRIIP